MYLRLYIRSLQNEFEHLCFFLVGTLVLIRESLWEASCARPWLDINLRKKHAYQGTSWPRAS